MGGDGFFLGCSTRYLMCNPKIQGGCALRMLASGVSRYLTFLLVGRWRPMPCACDVATSPPIHIEVRNGLRLYMRDLLLHPLFVAFCKEDRDI